MSQSGFVTDPEQLIRRRSLCCVLREALVYEADESRGPSGNRDRGSHNLSVHAHMLQYQSSDTVQQTISWSV